MVPFFYKKQYIIFNINSKMSIALVAGPCYYNQLRYKELCVHNFGDIHTKKECRQTDMSILDVLKNTFSHTTDIMDFMVEIDAPRKGRIHNPVPFYRSARPSYMNDMYYEFSDCLSLEEKDGVYRRPVSCQYPMVRFHDVDLRQINSTPDETDLEHIKEILRQIYTDLHSIDPSLVQSYIESIRQSYVTTLLQSQMANVTDPLVYGWLQKYYDSIFHPRPNHIIKDTLNGIMDVYVLARLFRTYEKRSDYGNASPRHVVLYTGVAHAYTYTEFFKRIGTVTHEIDRYVLPTSVITQCVYVPIVDGRLTSVKNPLWEQLAELDEQIMSISVELYNTIEPEFRQMNIPLDDATLTRKELQSWIMNHMGSDLSDLLRVFSSSTERIRDYAGMILKTLVIQWEDKYGTIQRQLNHLIAQHNTITGHTWNIPLPTTYLASDEKTEQILYPSNEQILAQALDVIRPFKRSDVTKQMVMEQLDSLIINKEQFTGSMKEIPPEFEQEKLLKEFHILHEDEVRFEEAIYDMLARGYSDESDPGYIEAMTELIGHPPPSIGSLERSDEEWTMFFQHRSVSYTTLHPYRVSRFYPELVALFLQDNTYWQQYRSFLYHATSLSALYPYMVRYIHSLQLLGKMSLSGELLIRLDAIIRWLQFMYTHVSDVTWRSSRVFVTTMETLLQDLFSHTNFHEKKGKKLSRKKQYRQKRKC